MSETTDPVETVRRLYDAFTRRDEPVLREILHERIEWNQMEGFPQGGRWIGVDEVFERVFKPFRQRWRSWKAETSEIVAVVGQPPRVVAFGRYVGEHEETGRQLEAPFAHVYTIEDGRVTRFEQFTDTLLVSRAAGEA